MGRWEAGKIGRWEKEVSLPFLGVTVGHVGEDRAVSYAFSTFLGARNLLYNKRLIIVTTPIILNTIHNVRG
jgi:hypothetical protein